jgi:HK97 family phage prohead protease
MPDDVPPALAGADLLRRDPEAGSDGMRLMAADDLAFAPGTYDRAAGTVDVVWSTGAQVRRYDWMNDRVYMEELDMAGADLARLQAGAPVLMDHWSSVRTLVGSVSPNSARVEKGRGLATLRFDRTSPEGQAVEAKVAAGHLRHVSIGYRVSKWEKLRGVGENDPDRWIARAFTPHEISFVPVPADAGAGTRGARSADETPAHPESTTRAPVAHNQEARMADHTQETGATSAPDNTVDVAAVRKAATDEARAAELQRAAEIREAGRGLGLTEEAEKLVAEGVEVATAQKRLIGELAKRREGAGAKPSPGHIVITRDEAETRHQGMEGWLLHRMDPRRYKLEGPATEARGMTMLDVARNCLEMGGQNTRGLVPTEIARMALGLPVRGFAVRSGTTSDFPNLLANVQSKRLMQAYDMEDRNYQVWARRRDLPDFKSARIIELGAAPTLKTLAEGGNIEHGVIGEGGEAWNLTRFARNVGLSYPAIVNDDLGGFDRMPTAFASAAVNLECTQVYGILAANGAMSDGTNLFASTRNVVVDTVTISQSNTTSGGLTTDNYAAVRTLLLRMRDATGQQMRTNPNVLIVPSELEPTALALFSMIVVPNSVATTGVNPYRGATTVVSTQFLTDANDWFVTVSAGTGYEAVEYGYESGMGAPDLTAYTDPEVDGMMFSCRHSFGAKAATFRTIGRSSN